MTWTKSVCYPLYEMLGTGRRRGTSARALDWVFLWGPVLLWMAAIFYVSSQNTWTVIEGPPAVQAARKTGHIFEYAVLGLLLGRALLGTWRLRGQVITRALLVRVWWVGVLLCTLYAATDEFHQLFVPRREGKIGDVVVDGLSATAALGIAYIIKTRRRRD